MKAREITKTQNVALTEDLQMLLIQQAQDEDRSISSIVRKALIDYLRKHGKLNGDKGINNV